MQYNLKKELARNYKGLKKEQRLPEWKEEFRQIMKDGHLTGTDWPLKEQFMMLVDGGRDMVLDRNDFRSMNVSEAVSTADFANVNGQIVYNEVMKGYTNEVFISQELQTTVPTDLNGEKIGGATNIGDDAGVVSEGMPFPEVGISEDFIETPMTDKYGLIVSVTKEAIFFDRTMQVLKNASDVGKAIGIRKEKRSLSTILGITNSYNRRSVAIDSYGNSSGVHDWDNLSASTALQDWTDLDAVWQLLAAVTDPNTGEPILNIPSQIIIPPALRDTIKRVLNATHVEATTNTSNVTRSGSPNDPYQWYTSQYVTSVGGSSTTWFMGNFREAFRYMENWPMTVTSQQAGATAEFERDILVRHKASERGSPAVYDPRLVAKATA